MPAKQGGFQSKSVIFVTSIPIPKAPMGRGWADIHMVKGVFVRFGFDWFERFCNHYNCEIIVINNPDTSPQQELIDDLISIIHVFSCRIHGLRKYKKDIRLDESLQDGDLSHQETKTTNPSDNR